MFVGFVANITFLLFRSLAKRRVDEEGTRVALKNCLKCFCVRCWVQRVSVQRESRQSHDCSAGIPTLEPYPSNKTHLETRKTAIAASYNRSFAPCCEDRSVGDQTIRCFFFQRHVLGRWVLKHA